MVSNFVCTKSNQSVLLFYNGYFYKTVNSQPTRLITIIYTNNSTLKSLDIHIQTSRKKTCT